MNQVNDEVVSTLLAEGRKWVPYPGDRCHGGAVTQVVFENYPYHLVVALLSELSSLRVPIVIKADDPEKWCKEWSIERGLVRDEQDYLTVIMSSIGAQLRCRQVKLLRDKGTNLRLQDGLGNEIQLDDENAFALYQDLAAAQDLPFAMRCVQCGETHMNDELCQSCELEGDDDLLLDELPSPQHA